MTDPNKTKSLDDAALGAVVGGNRYTYLPGTSGNDSIGATDGVDLIYGYEGQDTIAAGDGHDVVDAGDGDDSVRGDGGHDRILGGSGQDTLLGGAGDDHLIGGEGDDTIVGGTGQDSLVGGTGQDTFFWHPGDGNDTVNGGSGDDTLRLEDSGYSLEQLFGMIRVDPGSPAPRMDNGFIDLKGVSGSITIGHETITFSDLERLVIGGYTHFDGR